MRSVYCHLKTKIISLRKSGKTYEEIRKIIGINVPKSTLSNWCSNVSLSREQQQKIELLMKKGAEKGRATALIINKLKRERNTFKV